MNFFDDYFSAKDENMLVELLSELNDEDFTNIITKLTILRRLEERLFDIIAINLYGETPANISTQKMSRTKNIIIRLKNQRKLPLYLFDFAMDIYSLSSRYGAHSSPSNRKHFQPTKYTVNSLIYAFMELCIFTKTKLLNF